MDEKQGNYRFTEIEKKWQTHWESNKTFKAVESDKPKYYVLDMFPYPSGEGLHIGHAWNNNMKDIALRYFRKNGYDVWDGISYVYLFLHEKVGYEKIFEKIRIGKRQT